uniref:Uncharacterized protein n=1 Tax=Arundo donax TaxID=35708 RepID=A0A0A9HQ02_ARUDO
MTSDAFSMPPILNKLTLCTVLYHRLRATAIAEIILTRSTSFVHSLTNLPFCLYICFDL